MLPASLLIVGLLIGPRGNTLKKMETESGAKIAIRGKGSVKEGKGRSDAAHTSNQEEDLHCLIMADTEEKVNKAKKLINNIIETVIPSPPTSPKFLANKIFRLLLSLRARTSLSATSFVSLPLSTALSVTMRTRLARTVSCPSQSSSVSHTSQVVKSVIANTTVPSNVTSPPTSFVVSVATLAIWLVIVQIVSVVRTGATTLAADLPVALVSVKAMPLTVSTRYASLSPFSQFLY